MSVAAPQPSAAATTSTANAANAVGVHLIVDLHGAQGLDDTTLMRQALLDCVQAAGATLLHIHLHRFEVGGGLSGVAVLAESHIAVHSWPETAYAAFDLFMCGQADPHRALDVLQRAFRPQEMQVRELLRGPAAPPSDG